MEEIKKNVDVETDYQKLESIINECIRRTDNASPEEISRMQSIYDKYVTGEM